MTKQTLAKTSLIALALVLGASALSPSTSMAGGYMMGMGRDGEVTCEPGGTQDCPTDQG